jgi:hypothetical protein
MDACLLLWERVLLPPLLVMHLSFERCLPLIQRDQWIRWALSTMPCLLQQMSMVRQQTQQQYCFWYHCCHSQCCRWSLSGVAAFRGGTKMLEWRGGKLLHGIIARILLYCVGETAGRTDVKCGHVAMATNFCWSPLFCPFMNLSAMAKCQHFPTQKFRLLYDVYAIF